MQLLRYELNGDVFASYEVAAAALSHHEERTIRLGAARAVLPVALTRCGDRLTVSFDEEETEPLTGYVWRERGSWENQGDRILGFATRIVLGLLDAEDHFLPLSLFAIGGETVRIRPDGGKLFLLPDLTRRDTSRPAERRTGNGGTISETGIEEESASPETGGETEADRLRAELAVFLGVLGSGLSDGAWNRYRERLFYDLREGKGGLRSVYGLIERARGELYRIGSEDGPLAGGTPQKKSPLGRAGF